MNPKETVKLFWSLFDQQDFEEAGKLLTETFRCSWPCTNEQFDKTSFIKVNVEYPGKWFTKLIKSHETENGVHSIVHVYSNEVVDNYYATSLFTFEEDKISSIEEYWSAIETPPKWRQS